MKRRPLALATLRLHYICRDGRCRPAGETSAKLGGGKRRRRYGSAKVSRCTDGGAETGPSGCSIGKGAPTRPGKRPEMAGSAVPGGRLVAELGALSPDESDGERYTWQNGRRAHRFSREHHELIFPVEFRWLFRAPAAVESRTGRDGRSLSFPLLLVEVPSKPSQAGTTRRHTFSRTNM
ncbi:hypothetical protein BDW22DRAFT_255464 [Trametopsis cervina]|nr:hypothetical protein BDW22DRAFT_255464 [Trametopsis cervina]